MAENDPATAIGSNVEKIPAARENEDQPHNLKRKKHQLVEPTRRSVRQEKVRRFRVKLFLTLYKESFLCLFISVIFPPNTYQLGFSHSFSTATVEVWQ
jgi:hypothetical protein